MNTTTIPDEIRAKLAKIAELAERGATEGERQAARAAMERVMKAAGIDPEKMGDPRKKHYRFSYAYERESILLQAVRAFHLSDEGKKCELYRGDYRKREIMMMLRYEDYITLHCAYEYFRAHMKAQHKKHIEPHFSRLTKAQRQTANMNFVVNYLRKSQMLDASRVVESKATKAEQEAIRLSQNIEGGKYRTQLTTEERMIGTSQPTPKPPRPSAAIGEQTSLF